MFNQTKHIIRNHYISHNKNQIIVKKCVPFKIEVVVRGYITGNTTTSLWTHYNNGIRNTVELIFLIILKNQKLPNIVITPTTKDKEDILYQKKI